MLSSNKEGIMQANDAFRLIPAEVADKLIGYIATVGCVWAYVFAPVIDAVAK